MWAPGRVPGQSARHRWRDRWQGEPCCVPLAIGKDRRAQWWHAGEDRLRANHAQLDHGAQGRAPAVPRERPAEQRRRSIGSATLMFLVAASFISSALISLTVLWFAISGILWLLHQ